MRESLLLTSLFTVATLVLMSSQAIAAPLDWGYQLNAADEACPPGKKLINITRKISGSLDSGTGNSDYGNAYWATSNYIQQIQVVEIGTDEFCARVTTRGDFESVGGDGPGCSEEDNCGTADGRLEASVVGTFQGGATQIIYGVFNPGQNRTKGSIGKYDADCNPETGLCPGGGGSVFNSWIDDYYEAGFRRTYLWWGWVYHGGNNGSWVNATGGNQGNITGE
jgi:hypothetical protein